MPPRHIYYGKYPSSCHNSSTVLVKNKTAGQVSLNCSQCGSPAPLDIETMPSFLYCPVCDKPVERVKRTKTMFDCPRCQIKWELQTLVPEWTDLFPGEA